MSNHIDDATIHAVKHYLTRVQHILNKLSQKNDAAKLLNARLAADMFETGLNLAITIQFAARALCLPAGKPVPEIPDVFTCETLKKYAVDISEAIHEITTEDIKPNVSHIAGNAKLTQSADDYILRFAYPNMIFHFSLAYAALRQGGMKIGKADFDGLHAY